MKKQKFANKTVISGGKSIIFGTAVGILSELILALAATAFLNKAEAPENLYFPVALGILVISAFSAGAICSLLGKSSGLIRGISVGLFMSVCTVSAGLILPFGTVSPLRMLLSFAISAVFAGLGGLVTVHMIK